MKYAVMTAAGILLTLLGALVAVFFSVLADGERGMFGGPMLIGGAMVAIGIGTLGVSYVGGRSDGGDPRQRRSDLLGIFSFRALYSVPVGQPLHVPDVGRRGPSMSRGGRSDRR